VRKADITTRAIAGLVDLLLIIGLSRLPDVIGFLSAAGYILIRDGLFDRRSIGKKLIGLRLAPSEETGPEMTYRESLIRNTTFVAAYYLFLIPYAGWILGPLALGAEWLAILGDDRGMRIGDMLARTYVAADVPVLGGEKNVPVQPIETSPAAGSGPIDTHTG
jgi:uncharacterized RDD family membrane protein YckC